MVLATPMQRAILLSPRVAAASAFSPLSLAPSAWYKADTGVYSDAGVTPATDGQTIRQLNDQSGNGWTLTQGTSGSRPTYQAPVNGDIGGIQSSTKYLENTSFSVLNAATAFEIFIILSQVNSTSGGALITVGTSGAIVLEYTTNAKAEFFSASLAGGARNQMTSGINWLDHLAYDGSQSTNATKIQHFTNSYLYANTQGGTIPTSLTAANGIRIGTDFAGLPFNGVWHETIIFNKVLSSTERTSMVNYCKSRYAQGTRSYVTASGDSLTQGDSQGPSSWPTQLQTSLGTSWRITNMGINGTSLSASWVGGSALKDHYVFPSVGHTKDIHILMHGHNDLSSGQTAVQMMTNMTSFVTTLRASYPGIKIIAGCPWPSAAITAGAKETERTSFRDLVMAQDGVLFDKAVNTADLPHLQDPTNVTYFNADHIHILAAAATDVAAAFQTAVQAL